MASNGNTQLIFTLQGDQNELVANFGPYLPMQLEGTLQDMLNILGNTEETVQTAVALVNQAATEAAAVSLAPATATFDLVGYCLGVLIAAQPMLKAITPQAVTLPANLPGSYAYCDTAPTTNVTCPINRISAGVTTTVGSANFAAGYTTGTFTFASDVSTLPGDVIEILAPASVDPTLEGPAFGLSATITVAAGYVMLKQAAYTPMTVDRSALLVMNTAEAVVNMLPAGTGYTGSFPNGWRTSFLNIGAGTVTLVVPSGASLNGSVNGTIALTTGQGAQVWTDGSNWFAMVGV